MSVKLKRGVAFLCILFLHISQTYSISLEIVQRHHNKKSENVRAGKIHFGRDHISLGRNLNRTQYVSETPDDGFVNVQADSPSAGLASGQNIHDPRSFEVAWAQLRPKVQCTKDLMKFSAQGPGSSSLHLNRGGTSLPLNHLSQECGYSVYKTLVALVFLAAYDGCDVLKRDNNYLLSMLWHGIPVTLSCPVSAAGQTTDPTTETPSAASSLPPQQQQWVQALYPGSYYYNPFMHGKIPHHSTPAPTTEATSTTTKLPLQNQQQQWMQGLYGGYYSPFIHGKIPPQTTAAPTTEATSTTTKLPLQNQQQQWMQNLYYGGYYSPFIHGKIPPQTTAAPTTEATSTTTKLPLQNQQQQWMQGLYYGGYYNPFIHGKIPPQTTAAPTTEATSTTTKLPLQNQQQQWMQNLYYGGYYNPFIHGKIPPQTTAAPTTEATSTTTKLPLQHQHQQWMQGLYYGGYYSPFIHGKIPPQMTAAPTTEATSTTTKLPSQNQQQQWMQNLYYGGYYSPFIHGKIPPQTTAAPTTEAASTGSKLPPQNQQQSIDHLYNHFLFMPEEDPATPCPDEAESTAPSNSPQEQILYSKDPFQPFVVQFVNPSDPNLPKAKTKSWTRVLSQDYPFMGHRNIPSKHTSQVEEDIKSK